MSADYRLYCHTCKIRTKSLGDPCREWEPSSMYEFAKQHLGHDLELNEFSVRAKCKGTCYQPEYCEGDCYEEQARATLEGE
jgi:hypothetical protein